MFVPVYLSTGGVIFMFFMELGGHLWTVHGNHG